MEEDTTKHYLDSHIRCTKAFRIWTTYFQNKLKQKARLKRSNIKFQNNAAHSALLRWKDYAWSNSDHRRNVNVFIKLHPKRKSAVDSHLVERIFHVWAREFIPLIAENRRRIEAVATVRARRYVRIYLEIWVDGWAKILEQRFSIFRALTRLNSTVFSSQMRRTRVATVADKVFWGMDREKTLTSGNKSTTTCQSLFSPQTSETVVAAKLRCGKLIESLLLMKSREFLEHTYRTIHQSRLFHMWFRITNIQRRQMLRIRKRKLAIMNRSIRVRFCAESIASATSQKLLSRSIAAWISIVLEREKQERFKAFYFITKPALLHWKKLYNNRVVRRFREAPILLESHCSESVVAISCGIMERDHRQLYLRLLKGKRTRPQNGPVFSRSSPTSANSRFISHASSGSGKSMARSTSCDGTSESGRSNANGKTPPSAISQHIRRGGDSHNITDALIEETVLTSASIKSLWGSSVVDDCSQSTYLGQYARKTILKMSENYS